MTTPEPRMFSEAEHLAILTDRVATETASLSASVDTLTVAKTELETKLDVAIAEKAAADKAAADAVKEFEDYKASLEAASAAEAKKTERVEKLKTLAHLTPEFVADEARVARIVAMTDEVFEGYVADLAAAGSAPAAATTTKETAMAGTQVDAPTGTEKSFSAAASFLMPTLATEGGK